MGKLMSRDEEHPTILVEGVLGPVPVMKVQSTMATRSMPWRSNA